MDFDVFFLFFDILQEIYCVKNYSTIAPVLKNAAAIQTVNNALVRFYSKSKSTKHHREYISDSDSDSDSEDERPKGKKLIVSTLKNHIISFQILNSLIKTFCFEIDRVKVNFGVVKCAHSTACSMSIMTVWSRTMISKYWRRILCHWVIWIQMQKKSSARFWSKLGKHNLAKSHHTIWWMQNNIWPKYIML